MLYMRPGTSVIEFPMSCYSVAYRNLAACLDIEYWMVPSLTAYYDGYYHLDDLNIFHVVRTLRTVLERRGLHHLLIDQEL